GVNRDGSELIQVIDVESGKPCFQTSGWAPRFLSDGVLVGVRSSGQPMQVSAQFKVPEVVVWSSDGWAEKRAFPCDLGASPLSGPVLPRPWPTANGHQLALLYETSGGGWTGSARSSGAADSGWG